ncbi:PTS system mannose/fructose/sorbose family transporter subunit IID, partial [Enterococcus faecium]
MENSTEKKRLITKKDLHKMCLRSWTIMCSWNYERQMHMGFMYGMAPILNKVYKNDEEKKREAYTRHMAFFNCTPQMTPFIMGLCASMEEQNAQAEEGNFNTESISMIKTSLMGP